MIFGCLCGKGGKFLLTGPRLYLCDLRVLVLKDRERTVQFIVKLFYGRCFFCCRRFILRIGDFLKHIRCGALCRLFSRLLFLLNDLLRRFFLNWCNLFSCGSGCFSCRNRHFSCRNLLFSCRKIFCGFRNGFINVSIDIINVCVYCRRDNRFFCCRHWSIGDFGKQVRSARLSFPGRRCLYRFIRIDNRRRILRALLHCRANLLNKFRCRFRRRCRTRNAAIIRSPLVCSLVNFIQKRKDLVNLVLLTGVITIIQAAPYTSGFCVHIVRPLSSFRSVPGRILAVCFHDLFQLVIFALQIVMRSLCATESIHIGRDKIKHKSRDKLLSGSLPERIYICLLYIFFRGSGMI